LARLDDRAGGHDRATGHHLHGRGAFLGEPFTAWIAAGTVLVISGIFVFTRSAR
jgi:hypothetical protein